MDSIGTPPMDPTRPDKLLFLPLDNWRKVKKKRSSKDHRTERSLVIKKVKRDTLRVKRTRKR